MEKTLHERRRAQELRKNQTKEENHLWYDFLKTYPLQFKRQYPIGAYYVDFYCYKARLIVELDGSQHTNPQSIAYDNRRTEFLEKQGFLVLRISNLDIWKNFDGVCTYIDMLARERAQFETREKD